MKNRERNESYESKYFLLHNKPNCNGGPIVYSFSGTAIILTTEHLNLSIDRKINDSEYLFTLFTVVAVMHNIAD